MTKQDFGTYGAWRWESGIDERFAQAVERLGYGALWVGGSPSAELAPVERALDATEHITVATGIVNIWKDAAVDVAASFRRIEERHPGRFVLGIGSGHREATPERVRPLTALREYVAVLAAEGLRQDQMLLAALGDRTLAFSAEATLGAHPYLTVPEHTAHARPILGDALLAPELKVSLDADQGKAREIARNYLKKYFGLQNYTNALVRFGVDPDDIASGGSDALIDRVAANPTAAAAVLGAQAHLDAGADHLSFQALGDDPIGSLEQIAEALRLG
ncbi:TIGR03620 family F420-dependent LLM class oxidoreductase [Microbacterium halophytorum]|uniref:TIGR03620 family F420-dependent LLM class oxidoreductase n=1 Tax=Microbacterium halophytorum TaxID=2067568 RepID=UPI000CFBC529|nr:TIGR03620 family F420-dependent LLM class oxidoreductase [Microbacterium halophytorum]